MTQQRPRTSTSTPPSAYHSPWTHSANAASDPALNIGLGRPQATRYYSDRTTTPAYRRSTQPAHHSTSSDMISQDPSGSSTPKGALKVLTSVRRSISSAVAKKSAGPSATFTNSTAEETAAAQIRMTDTSSSSKPPTVQQIAAGLVTGRNPALNRRPSLPPPPARSSLKKASIDGSASSSSSTSLASTSLLSTGGSTTTRATSIASSHRRRRRFSIKGALFRRSASPIPPVPDLPKAVRFSVDQTPVAKPTPLP